MVWRIQSRGWGIFLVASSTGLTLKEHNTWGPLSILERLGTNLSVLL